MTSEKTRKPPIKHVSAREIIRAKDLPTVIEVDFDFADESVSDVSIEQPIPCAKKSSQNGKADERAQMKKPCPVLSEPKKTESTDMMLTTTMS